MKTFPCVGIVGVFWRKKWSEKKAKGEREREKAGTDLLEREEKGKERRGWHGVEMYLGTLVKIGMNPKADGFSHDCSRKGLIEQQAFANNPTNVRIDRSDLGFVRDRFSLAKNTLRHENKNKDKKMLAILCV